jgi:hypothetical protein
MLKLVIEGTEYYNQETETFETVGDVVLMLEHSLVSVSKWESKFEKPFLTKDNKTTEEVLFYVEAMILTPNYPEGIINSFTQKSIDAVNNYIESKQSATTFGKMPEQRSRGEIITSELIYYWMVAFNIPFECQHWHLNRLLALVRICNIKASKPKKMGRTELLQRNRQLNEQRKAELGTRG